jgi:hypothetical protein
VAKKKTSSGTKAKQSRARSKAPPVSRLRPPDGISLEEWQIALRRQFGRDQNFALSNLDEDPLFGDFRVTNPKSGGAYQVSIRSSALAANRCTCADFATNELGTCKHIEFALAKLERRRGAKAALTRGQMPTYSEVWLQYGAERSIHLRIGSDCPQVVTAAARKIFEVADSWRLPTTRLHSLDGFVALARRHRHELRIHDDTLRFIAQVGVADTRRHVLHDAYPLGAADPALREILRMPLFPYQLEGALFAATAGRALIADEMGLGKTAQAIATTELLRRHFDTRRVLIVCPTSLKHQWARELERFAGRTALIIEGNAVERARLYASPADCKIVSYDSLVRDIDLVNAWAADVLVVDEAQRIKNWDTRAARSLKRIETNHAVVLTGTPLENRLQELLSVVQLVDRHRLGPTWRFLHEHQISDDSGRVTGYRNLDRIGETLAPIMLRRRKREVLEQLPERRDRNLFVPLTDLQRALHDEQADIVARIVNRWRKHGHLSDSDQKRLQAALQRMRMVCDSTYLIDPTSNEGNKIPELLEWLDERLADAEAKVVIFSAWIGTHELIAAELEARGIGHVLFNGSVPARDRGQLVDRFRDDPDCRLFLSTDAGGVGLNLQDAAALIVNMDLPWNPAVLEQRIGRVYRLGQKRRVEVLNFVAERSIEESMLDMLKFKRSLFEGALDGGAGEVSLQGTRLSRFMQNVETLTQPGPAAAQLIPISAVDVDTTASSTTKDVGRSAAPDPSSDTLTTISALPTATMNSTSGSDAVPAGITTASMAAVQPLLQLASDWLARLGCAIAQPETSPLIERDPTSGRATLRLPLPDTDLLHRLADAVQALAKPPAADGKDSKAE